jgi:hypothetical protein
MQNFWIEGLSLGVIQRGVGASLVALIEENPAFCE